MAYDSPNEAEEAASLLALARQTHEAHVAAAKGKAEAILARAQEEADVILTNAREEFTWLEEKIAKHREFEARYRGAISTYLQDLLDEINQDDEFVAPASLSPVVEEPEEDSAFAVEEEPAVELEPVVAEPEYYSEPEPVFEPVPEPAYEEPVAAEPEDEFTYSTPVVEQEPAVEAPAFNSADDEFTYETPVIEEVDEPAPTFAEGDAPVPSFEAAPAEPVDDYYTQDTSDDLPEVPESIDSFGSGADEIEALNNELQDHHPEDQEEIENFDSLISGEPKPATGSVAAQSDEAEDEEVDKGVRGFFGFKKS